MYISGYNNKRCIKTVQKVLLRSLIIWRPTQALTEPWTMGALITSTHLSKITYELQFKTSSNQEVFVLVMLPGFGSRLNFRQSKKHNFTTRIRHESKSELKRGLGPSCLVHECCHWYKGRRCRAGSALSLYYCHQLWNCTQTLGFASIVALIHPYFLVHAYSSICPKPLT